MAATEKHTGFLGRGWAWPPSWDKSTRGTEMVADEEDIYQSLNILLATNIGERVMNRKYGAGLERVLHEPLTEANIHTIALSLKDAIRAYEPRIRVEQVRLVQEDMAMGRLDVLVEYTILATNSTQNRVFPYYSTPQENPDA